MNKKTVGIIIGVIVIIGILVWAFITSIQPLPGQSVVWSSRNHLPEGTVIDYVHNSTPNLTDHEPPTSGDHYSSWITKGFYNEPRLDAYLVHSMEHGYVIFWYNCDQKVTGLSSFDIRELGSALVGTTYAQSAAPNMGMTTGSEGSASATLSQMPKSFSDGSCTNFENQIKQVMNDNNGGHKLIALPRPEMDAPLILTAWGKMEKLSSVDSNAIKAFINAYRDNGPETTSEP